MRDSVSELSGITAARLARQDLGGDLNFESGVIFFSRTLRLFHALNEADLDDIPYSKLQQLVQQADDTIKRCQEILEFSLQKHQENPIAVRDQFISQIRERYDSIFDVAGPIVAFTVRKGTDFVRLEDQARTAMSRISEESEKHSVALAEARTNAENLVNEVRRIAEEAGVSQHAVHFKTEADSHARAARSWLTATVTLAAVTVIVGAVLLFVYFDRITELTPAQGVQLAISKLVIFSAILSATFWAGRTYRAHRHNSVINRHRQNALATFQTFAKAASDDQTRNAVLLQATQCIFAPQQTGYVHGDSDVAPTSQVLEIVRNVSHKP